LLLELVGGPGGALPVGAERLSPRVYRLHFRGGGRVASLVVKRLDPCAARRNQLVAECWLPAVGLGENGPPLLGVAAERDGRYVWHAYEDLGDRVLDEQAPDPGPVAAAVELIARVHARFAERAVLAECRLWGTDLGASFYGRSMRDAIRSLQVLRQTPTALPPERAALCDHLLRQLYRLLDEEPSRARGLEEHGGPETLLHGDPWPKNALVIPAGRGLHARLIDWDRAGVGPVGYDLSTFLGRLAAPLRPRALELYRQAAGRLGWRLPLAAELNRLFETAELARLANCVIWPALAAAEGQPAWAFDQLADLEQWLQRVEPVLPSR
jgi:hypothetical protein